jgi:peptidoglycan/LPS O-acetylase OafA/YrhL
MLVVFGFHGAGQFASHGIALPESVSTWLLLGGPWGTNFFLALSGAMIWRRRALLSRGFGTYLKRRVNRILPAYWLLLAIYLLGHSIFPEKGKLPTSVADLSWMMLKEATMTRFFLDGTTIQSAAWTLHFIVLGYLVIPIFQRCCEVLSELSRLIVLVGALIVVNGSDPFFGQRAVLFMLCGILATEAVWLAEEYSNRVLWWIGPVIALLQPAGVGASLLMLLLMAVLLTHRSERVPMMSWLGDRSYSFYLAHGLGLHSVLLVTHGRVANLAQLPYGEWILAFASLQAALMWTVIVYQTAEVGVSVVPLGGPIQTVREALHIDFGHEAQAVARRR